MEMKTNLPRGCVYMYSLYEKKKEIGICSLWNLIEKLLAETSSQVWSQARSITWSPTNSTKSTALCTHVTGSDLEHNVACGEGKG